MLLVAAALDAQAEEPSSAVSDSPVVSSAGPEVPGTPYLTTEADSVGRKQPAHFLRGSSFSVSNQVSANTFDKSGDLTYNPYYALDFALAPYFWLNDWVNVHANMGLSREITEADDTTHKNETLFHDFSLGVGATPFSKWGLRTTASLDVRLPLSLVSQARTLRVGLSANLGASYSWKIPYVGSVALSYSLTGVRNFYEYTTGELDGPSVPCANSMQCDSLFNTGVRNVAWRLQNAFGLSVSPLDWITVSARAGFIDDFLFDVAEIEESNVSYIENTDRRDLALYGLEVEVTPIEQLSIALGQSTVNPVLASDSTRETAFFNRYTTWYLDLRLNIAALFAEKD